MIGQHDGRPAYLGVKPMKSNAKTDAADFMEKWLAHNISAHPAPQDLATAVKALTHNCLDAAAAAGISAAEIELKTGSLAADLIQKAIDKEIGKTRRPAGELRKSQSGKPGAQQPPVTVIARQPEPPPYRLPARGHH
jgi:hypothetical protein